MTSLGFKDYPTRQNSYRLTVRSADVHSLVVVDRRQRGQDIVNPLEHLAHPGPAAGIEFEEDIRVNTSVNDIKLERVRGCVSVLMQSAGVPVSDGEVPPLLVELA